MWDFFLIDLKDITSSIEREKFSESELATVANLIVEMRGLMRPVLLKKIGFEHFEVIDGHREYYASLMAKEKEPSLETINAFVIEAEAESIALQQIQALSRIFVEPIEPIVTKETETSDIEQKFTRFQQSIEQQLQKLKDEYRENIQTFHQEYEQKLQFVNQKIDRIAQPIIKEKPTILQVVNTYSEKQLASMGLGATIAKKIVQQRPFDSFSDMKDKIKARWTTNIFMEFLDAYESL